MFSCENTGEAYGLSRIVNDKILSFGWRQMSRLLWLIRVFLTDSRSQSQNEKHQTNRGNAKQEYSGLIKGKRREPIGGEGGQRRRSGETSGE